MKRIAILMVTVLLGLSATASSVHYFTRSQAERAVNYLNRQNEIMIYCGYEYEIETYVLVNEVWAERINSAYYELWIFGYDAYTGDEIYMPLDLQCVWLYGAGRMYNAAQYLRFRTSVRTPHFTWYIPPYHPYTRVIHRPGYVRSYHYDIHCHGWMPPAHPAYHGPHHHHGPAHPPLPPYYNRAQQTPAPAPTTRWTPGVDRPQVSSSPRNTSTSTGNAPTGSPRAGSTTGTPSNTRVTTGTATETRGANGTTTNTRSTGTSTGTSTSTRSTSTSTGTSTSTRSTSTRSTSTSTRSTGTSTSTSTSTRSTTAPATEVKTTSRNSTTTRSTSNTPTKANTGTASRSTTNDTKATETSSSTRGTRSTATSSTSTRGTSTSTRSTSGSTSTRGTSTSTRGTSTSTRGTNKR